MVGASRALQSKIMLTQGGLALLRRVLRNLLAGAFLLAMLPPAAFADSAGSAPVTLPAIQLTALPGGVSSPVHVTHAGDGSGRCREARSGTQTGTHSSDGGPNLLFLRTGFRYHYQP